MTYWQQNIENFISCNTERGQGTVCGPGDLKPTECAQGENIGPEALSGSIGVELYRGVHVDCLRLANLPMLSITVTQTFLISQYFLSRGNPQALRKDWSSIVALNFTLLISTIICLVVEPNKGAKLETLCLAILAVACSYAGAALAARTARS